MTTFSVPAVPLIRRAVSTMGKDADYNSVRRMVHLIPALLMLLAQGLGGPDEAAHRDLLRHMLTVARAEQAASVKHDSPEPVISERASANVRIVELSIDGTAPEPLLVRDVRTAQAPRDGPVV